MEDNKFRKNYVPFKKQGLICPEETRTKQAFKDECNINTILKKYNKNGVLPDLIKTNPKYGDFSNAPTYQESLNTVIHANEQFAALSAKVRERFLNDPARFLEFASDPKNMTEMVKLGLATVKKDEPNLAKDIAKEISSLQVSKEDQDTSSPKGKKVLDPR